jgi:plasmid stabilization system protein ParE
MTQQRYVLSPEAITDLLDLETFLTEREGRERALTVIARLHRAMTSLSDYPGIGRRRKEFGGGPQSYAVQSWIIFYRPNADRTAVEISALLTAAAT